MTYKQLSIFDVLENKIDYKVKKQLNVIECFAGYGSQRLALKYLGADFRHHRICEWAIPSIIAYADVHRNELPNYGIDYCGDLTKEEIAQKLFELGVSADYNSPATLKQLTRMNIDKLKLVYNSIKWTNNLVDISRVKGKDLGIEEEKEYLLTYSFPCQDLSLRGTQKGMQKGSGTRSGLLWEVERILNECDVKPRILLLENVPQVHGSKNKEHFLQWIKALEEMGYNSYWDDLTSVDFGIPQSRKRTFMISIWGSYVYNFPKKIKLDLRLKHLLEKDVDESYCLSEKMLNYIIANNEKWTGNNNKSLINKSIASTINTKEGCRRCDASNYISDILPDDYDLKAKIQEEINLYNLGIKRFNRRTGVVLNPNGVMTTLLARKQGDNSMVLEPNKTIKDVSAVDSNETATTTLITDFRIRKLTPRECFRLQGVKDKDIDLIMEHQSKRLGYHLAGDSITVNVLMRLFSTLLDINWEEKFNPKEWWNI